jgi:hypothetical protein
MAKVIILKKTGEKVVKPIKQSVMAAWMILIGLSLPKDTSEQVIDTNDFSNKWRNPMQDWAVFTDMEDKNIIFNKRYIAWIEE